MGETADVSVTMSAMKFNEGTPIAEVEKALEKSLEGIDCYGIQHHLNKRSAKSQIKEEQVASQVYPEIPANSIMEKLVEDLASGLPSDPSLNLKVCVEKTEEMEDEAVVLPSVDKEESKPVTLVEEVVPLDDEQIVEDR